MRTRAVVGLAVLAVVGLGACAPEESSSGSSTPSGADACAKDKLAVKLIKTRAFGNGNVLLSYAPAS